jgi:hypothetical protein
MHGEEASAELRHALHAFGHRVADVVQLQVEEDALARAHQLFGERQAAGISELIADLVDADGIAQPLHHRARGVDGGNIESQDQAVARIKSHNRPSRKLLRHFHQPARE